ncbi:hypothetical protein Tco_0619830, partial [Tanacetum coccineum]
MQEFMVAQKSSNDFVKNQFFNLKTKVEQGQKNYQAAIQDLEAKSGRIFDQYKAMNVSNTKVNSDRSKPVTSHSTPKPEQGVDSSHSVRRSTSKDIKSKNSILKNTKSSSAYVRKTLH